MIRKNIIFEIATSIWTNAEINSMVISGEGAPKIYKNGILDWASGGDCKQYSVAIDSVFNEEYTETLDSARITLDHVKEKYRLVNLKPYAYVRVFDANSWNGEKYTFDKIMLLDSYFEKETNIFEHLYQYDIKLFSETKLLEKIQCPNLNITHQVNDDGTTDKKTIYQKICEYMFLYVPRIKTKSGNYWTYNPILEIPGSLTGEGEFEPDAGTYQEDLYNKFNVTTADMSFSSPTLRQVLTTLMLQVSCIPTVNKGKLGFLDFNKRCATDNGSFAINETDYYIDNTVNFIQRGLSSDSFANKLVNMPEQVLDSENETVCENIGFRDKSNVLLKQKENLYLITDLPIYKINKVYMKGIKFPTPIDNVASKTWQAHWDPINGTLEEWNDTNLEIITQGTSYSGGNLVVLFGIRNADYNSTYEGIAFDYFSWRLKNPTFHICELKDNKITEIGRKTFSGNYSLMPSDSSTPFVFSVYTEFEFEDIEYDSDKTYFVWLDCEELMLGIVYEQNNVYYYADAPHLSENLQPSLPASTKWNFYFYDIEVTGQLRNVNVSLKVDITKLFLESSIRNNLENNFEDFASLGDDSSATIDDLSDYIYGTVGYTIGNNKIEGFSSVYYTGSGTFHGWISKDFTYIESITIFIKNHLANGGFNQIIEFSDILGMKGYPGLRNKDISWSDVTVTTPENFSLLLFDIYYQPFNSYNLSYTKENEDIDFPISQYNSDASGVSDFDRLSNHEQDTVNRIGNETLTISQRINYDLDMDVYLRGGTDQFEPVNYKDNEVIFKRTISIGNYKYDVSYTGSKNAILKNYFTTIRTKYRAYQYVDYNSSTVRKENHTIYVNIEPEGIGWINGDDKIYAVDQNELLTYFIAGCKDDYQDKRIKNVYEHTGEEDFAYKVNASVVTNKNSVAIIYQDFENESPGVYLTSTNSEIGGIPQNWYIYSSDFRFRPQLIYTFGSKYTKIGDIVPISFTELDSDVYSLPKDNDYNMLNIDNEESDIYKYIAFFLCDRNYAPEIHRTSYTLTVFKDQGETINRTLQFIYYTTSGCVKWTELFIKNSYISQTSDSLGCNFFYMSNDLEVNAEPHELKSGEAEWGSLASHVSVVKGGSSNHSYIRVNFYNDLNAQYVKVAYKDPETGLVRDFIAFKRTVTGHEEKFYVSLNDTKSDYVWERLPNGMLIKKYKAVRNDAGRGITNNF